MEGGKGLEEECLRLERGRGYNWVRWMSKTKTHLGAKGTRNVLYGITNYSHTKLGRKSFYSCLYRQLLFPSGQPPVPFLLITGSCVYTEEPPCPALEPVGACGLASPLDQGLASQGVNLPSYRDWFKDSCLAKQDQ